MSFTAKDFEILGSFYLGRDIDKETPFLYDSADLTTHAVIVGMTGSGKTGLGITLLEEAAIDGIPALIIDPKGDLANLALQFPNLAPEDFRPWISEEEAAREGRSPDDYAAAQAELWKNGLAKWGEDTARIAKLGESAEVEIYTPGSRAGTPVSVIQTLAAPPEEIRDEPELLNAQIETTVASLLGLLEIGGDPSRSREGVFLATLLHHHWDRGESLDLPTLAREIQKPPFNQVGILDIEAFFPEKERFQLVLALNTLLASPQFASWREGVPLDIQQLLYTPKGKPRLAVFSIAHLSDRERMFFVSMLLGAILSWMRQQRGSTALRALLYMDEIFGYFPPNGNPPSKKPLLTLMKQARAFGLGVVLATQNPADLDYKGLSNAGTWFVGRLQAERDKLRLLDGLAGLGLDRKAIDTKLSSLGKRKFLMNNVHENAPVIFETRWTLSYLCGPLTRDQIRRLKRGNGEQPATAPAAHSATEHTSAPPMVSKVRQIFPKTLQPGTLVPRLVGVATVRYRDPKAKVDLTENVALAIDFPDGLEPAAWDEGLPFDPADYTQNPPPPQPGVEWEAVPPQGLRAASYDSWKRDFANWLLDRHTLTLWECPLVNLVSTPDETEGDFRARLAPVLRDEREKKLNELREKAAKQEEALAAKLRAAEEKLRLLEAKAGESRLTTLLQGASTMLSLFLGRKKLSATTISRAGSTARGISRTLQQSETIAAARARIEELQAERNALEESVRQEMDTLRNTYDAATAPLTPRTLRPARTGTRVEWMALGWQQP